MSRSDRRRLHRQSVGPRAEIKFERYEVQSVIGEWLGSYANHAVAETPFQRTHALPFQPIFGIAVGMSLRNDAATQPLPRPFVVTLRA